MSYQINILGQAYSVFYKSRQEDKKLETMDGYTDVFAKEIVICDFKSESEEIESTKNVKGYSDQVFRHEVIHAFVYESGVQTLSDLEEEQLVEWFAIMFPKINEVIKMERVLVKDIVENKVYCPLDISVIPNTMGINLVSVDSVEWEKQDDGQLKKLTINFIPA